MSSAVLQDGVKPVPGASDQRTVELVREIYDGLATGDMTSVRAVLAPDIELVEPDGIPIGGSYHGREAVIDELFPAIAERFPDASIVPHRYLADGDTVVALGTMTATAAETGRGLESSFAHVFEFEDGLVVQWTSYFDTALFNAALEG